VSGKPEDDAMDDKPEGWESLAEEASEGSLAPSAELEEALREAAEAVEAREATRPRSDSGGASSAEVEELRAELDQTRDRMIRLQADFENHRRRGLKERQENLQYGHEGFAKDLLGTLDNMERAIHHAQHSETNDLESMLQGVELVQRELVGALAKYGVSEIEAMGHPFDPNFHEAMAQQEDDAVPEGTVVQVLQTGYRLRDRLLRPTRVMVSRRSAEENQDTGEPEEAQEN